MKKITKTHILPFVFSLIFFASCANEFETNVTPTPNNGPSQEVSIQLETPNTFASITKGLTEIEESTVNEICILAFKTGVLSYVKQVNVTNNQANISLKTSDNSSDTYKLVILANAYREPLKSYIGADLQKLNGATYDEVQASLVEMNITSPMFQSGGSIVMWGELPYEEINSTNCDFSVPLVRSIARIDVGLGATNYNQVTNLATWGGLSNFKLEEVLVYKPQTGYAYIPKTGTYDEDEKKVTQPTLTAANQNSTPFAYTVTNSKSIVQEIYVPEADIKMGTQGASGDANHTKRMAIVVKGSYNGLPSSYYRLDFIDKNKNLTNALRNHLYQFNIKSVSGNGFDNPDDAYKALATNIEVEVLEWNDGAIGQIVFDGQYMLGVSEAEFEFNGDQQTDIYAEKKLIITTDVPEGWTIDKIADENGNTANASWLTVGTNNGDPNINTTVDLTVAENTTGVTRTAYIYITASRLEYIVKVTQKAKLPYIPKKRLLTIGESKDVYGYNFSGTAASNQLITTAANYGMLPTSVVQTEGFEIIDGGNNPDEEEMLEWLITNPVDIVITAHNNSDIDEEIALFYKLYLDNGGVVIALQENDAAAEELLDAILGPVDVSGASGAGGVYKFFDLDEEILNGPFGNVRERYWGEDSSVTLRVTGFNKNDIVVLSNDENWSSSSATEEPSPYATAFRHKTLNFVWVGDAGFTSHAEGTTSLTACPFDLDNNNYPIPRPALYGSNSIKRSVENAIFTANVLAWALKKADEKNY